MFRAMGRGCRAAPLTRRSRDFGEGGADDRLASALDDALVATRAVDAPGASYGYMFRYAPDSQEDPDAVRRLGALADAMAEMEPTASEAASGIPPVWTLFGQFLDHDLSAVADRARGRLDLTRPGLAPRDRAEVEASLVNLRDGALRLDSLYRPDAGHGPLADKLARLMREPDASARLRVDLAEPSPVGAPPLPADGGADLLRLGRLLADDPAVGVTEAEIMTLPPEIRSSFLRGGQVNRARPIIGDVRNDSTLALSQLHLALIRLHNRIVDELAGEGGTPPHRLFEETRRLMRLHVQWLALEVYLPRVCDPWVLARVRAAGAPVYTEFANAVRRSGSDRMPMPLEYVFGASGFRHSMSRGETDHNRFHGRPAQGAPASGARRATLEFLHASTGAALAWRLPSDRIIEWERYVADPPVHPDRSARRIDTAIAPPRRHGEAFRRLARRMLMRGFEFNLPSAQDCVAEFNQIYGGLIRPLNREELSSGHTGEAICGGLAAQTPLWFYVLKEAEIRAQGERLGPLGSALLAETLIGTAANDPDSALRAQGAEGRRWHPQDGARPGGRVLSDMQAVLEAAEVL